MKLREYFTNEGKGVIFLILPLLFKWLLPPGLETKLYFSVLGVFCLFLPNILLVFAPKYLHESDIDTRLIKPLFTIWILLEVFMIFISDSPNPFMNVLSNTFMFFALYVGFFYRLSEQQIKLAVPLICLGVFVLSIQMITLATGLVKYDLGDVSDNQFSGIIRTYTTAGDSNASGNIISILSFFLLLAQNNSKKKIAICVMAVVAVFFTVTRSCTFLVILTYSFLWFKFLRHNVKLNFIFLCTIATLFYAGVFNPIIERTSAKSDDGDLTSGRNILIASVLSDVSQNHAEWFGLGVGNVYQSTEVFYSKTNMPYPGAPHNSYILIFAEQGIVGLFFFFSCVLIYLFKGYKYKRLSIPILFLILITLFNTETGICTNSDQIITVTLLMLLINNIGYPEIFR